MNNVTTSSEVVTYPMRFTRILAAFSLAFVLSTGAAFAQVTPGATTTVPGTPATGVAEDTAAMNAIILTGSAIVMLAGAVYLGFGRRLFVRP